MKSFKKLKIWALLAVAVIYCAACGSSDKGETTTTSKENAGETVTSINGESNSYAENLEDTENTTSDEANTNTESSSEDESSSEEETTSKDENTSTSEKESSSEKQTTTTKPTTEKPTKPVTEQTTASSGNSGNSGQNSQSELDYLTYNVDYDYDNYLAGTISWDSYGALGALKNGRAVCDGYAKAFYEMAKEAGLEVKRITGTADNGSGSGYVGHAWNQVKIDGVWYNLDATWDDPTWKGKLASDHSANGYSYCLVSDATLEKDHKPGSYSGKESCPKDFDGASLYNAITVSNPDVKGIYAANESELRTKLVEYVKKGNTDFGVYMSTELTNYLEVFEEILASTKTPVTVWGSAGYGDRLIRYDVVKQEDAYVVTTLDDIKSVLDNNKDKIENIQIWYFDDALEEDNDLHNEVNATLIKAGYMYEVNICSMVRYGKVVFTLSKLQNTIIVKDMSDIKTYVQNHSLDDVLKQTFVYVGDLATEDMAMAINDALVAKGYIGNSFLMNDINGIAKMQALEVKEVFYIDNASQVVDYIKNNGINSLIDKVITTRCGLSDSYDFVMDIALDVSAQSGYLLADSFNCYSYYGYVNFWFYYVDEAAYVSGDLAGFKADIEDAISKGVVDNSTFYYVDKTSDLGGQFANVEELIKATGCNVSLWYSSYYGGEYHMIYLRAN